jgi:hypothetical protein
LVPVTICPPNTDLFEPPNAVKRLPAPFFPLPFITASIRTERAADRTKSHVVFVLSLKAGKSTTEARRHSKRVLFLTGRETTAGQKSRPSADRRQAHPATAAGAIGPE